jgi:hypothetical protein
MLPTMSSASDYYRKNAEKCSAILGRFLFEEERLSESDFEGEAEVYFCAGDRVWISVTGGMESMIREVRRQVEINDQSGLRNSELAEDWGVIANDAGQIIARASYNGGVCKLRYLGESGGPIETAPITVQRIGIAWEPRESANARDQRQRG